VFQRLRQFHWPAAVRVLDVNASGGAVGLFSGCDKAVVVDALPPGSGRPGQVLRLADYPHDPQGAAAGGGAGILRTVRRTISPLPDIEVIGAVAVRCRPFQAGLSPLVMAASESVVALLCREFGARRRPRRPTSLPSTQQALCEE
jgi:Ni,Fe-hydrogenase maturation factor